MEVPATLANLEQMLDFVVSCAQEQGFAGETLGQIRLACEEALVNVVNYAYPGSEGMVAITCSPALARAPAPGAGITIEITDSGIPFDPLSLPEPDTKLPMEQRQIGGLGIFMIRRVMNEVKYRRDNDRNVLTFTKFK